MSEKGEAKADCATGVSERGARPMTDDELLAAVEDWGVLDRAQLERMRQALAERRFLAALSRSPPMDEAKDAGATSCPGCGGSGYLPPEQAWTPCPRCHGTGQTSCPHCGDRDPFSPRRCVLPVGHDGLHRDTEEREAEFARISGPQRELSEDDKAILNGQFVCDDEDPSR